MVKKEPNKSKSDKADESHEFISATEVEEHYFPKSRTRRTEGRIPLDVETHRRVKDALVDLGAKN